MAAETEVGETQMLNTDVTRDPGPICPAHPAFEPSSLKYCKDFVDGEWKSFFDFIPTPSDVREFLHCPDGRASLTFVALKSFLADPANSIPGLGRTDRFCTAIDTGPELGVVFLYYSLRCAVAPLNRALRQDEFEFEFDDLPAKGLMLEHKDTLDEQGMKLTGIACTAARRRKVPIIVQMLPSRSTVGLFTIDKHPASKPLAGEVDAAPLESIMRDHVGLVLHTTGTTKKPKIVPITHCSLAVGCRCHSVANCMTESDCFVNYMPMFHIAGLLENFLTSLLSASHFVALRGMFDAEVFYNSLYRRPCPTCYSGVPVQHLALIQQAQRVEKESGKPHANSLKFIRNDSAALVPTLAQQMEDYLGCTVMPAYSMTESNPICSNPRLGARKLKSVGPTVGPDLCIMAAWPSDTILGPGQDGEVCVRGACVMRGYEHRPHMDQDPNIEAFTAGWMRSGDNGWMDADGYLYLIGRFKELINRAGEKVSPFEVEDAVRMHDAVQDCICFAAPHRLFGEATGIAAVLKPGKTLKIFPLRQWLLAGNRLLDKWCPEVLVVMPELPKGPTGKAVRINLAAKLSIPVLEGAHLDIDLCAAAS